MENLNEDYSKLMEYLNAVDRTLKLSQKLQEMNRLIKFDKSMLMPLERRNLLMYSKLLEPDLLEKKCIYCTELPPKTNYKFVEIDSIKDVDFKPTPIHIFGTSYPVQQVCIYEKSWLDEYYYNSFNNISNSILKEENNIHELNDRDNNNRLIQLLEVKEQKSKETKEIIKNEYHQENDNIENEERTSKSSNTQNQQNDSNKSEISEENLKEDDRIRISIGNSIENKPKKSKHCCCCNLL